MKKMLEWKSWKGFHKELKRKGYKGPFKKISISRWRNLVSPLIYMALPNKSFDELGLVDMGKQKLAFCIFIMKDKD